MSYTSREDAYVAGRASAAVELMESREALNQALRRERDLLEQWRASRQHLQRQQWVSMGFACGCVCLTLFCIFLWAQLAQKNC